MLDRYLPAEPRRQGEQLPPQLYSSDDIFRHIRPDEARACLEAMAARPESANVLRSYLARTEQQLATVRDHPELYDIIKADSDQAVAQFLRDTAPMARLASQALNRAAGWGNILKRLRDR